MLVMSTAAPILLAYDYNNNGRRDYGEPIANNSHERFDDVGVDGCADAYENGSGGCNTTPANTDTDLNGDNYDVENNPTMSFTSTEVTEDTLKGDLTIKGVTKPVEFDLDFNGLATDPWGNQKAGFEATTEINRKDWGLEWNVALEGGGVLVSEKIKINLDVQLLKAA